MSNAVSQELQMLVNKFDVPSHKRTLDQGKNLKWLLDNLPARDTNLQHPEFKHTYGLLIALAVQRKEVKNCDLPRYYAFVKGQKDV